MLVRPLWPRAAERESEPADHAAAHPLGDRGQMDLSDRRGGKHSACRQQRSHPRPRALPLPMPEKPEWFELRQPEWSACSSATP